MHGCDMSSVIGKGAKALMNRFINRQRFCLPLRYWLPLFLAAYAFALALLFFSLHRHDGESGLVYPALLGSTAGLVLVAFGIVHFTISRRALHLIQSVNRLAQGDLHTRVTLTGSDEFTAIGAAFNQMAEQLAANYERYEQTKAALHANQELMQGLLARLDVVVWSASAVDNHYYYISPSIEQVHGQPPSAFMANRNLWQEIIYPADRELVLEAYRAIEVSGTKQMEYRIVQPDGSLRWLLQRSILVRDDNGQPRRFDGVVSDITAYKQDQALLAERARLASLRADIGTILVQSNALAVILQQCAEAVVTHLDANFVRIWTLNEVTQTLELQASAGLYTHLDGHHSRIRLGQWLVGQIAQQRQPYLTNNVPADPQISDQEWVQRAGIVAFAGYPLIVEDNVVGVIATFAHRTLSQAMLDDLGFVASSLAQLIERKHAEEALRVSEERFRLALDGAHDGVWDWEVTTGTIVSNQHWAALLGYDRYEIESTLEAWEQLIHPDDKSAVHAAFQAHVAGLAPYYECEHRVFTKSGEWKWVLDRGKIVARDAQGQALRVTGILEDINARKQAELVLQNFFRLSLDLLCIAGVDGYFKYVNPAFEQILGFSATELLATPFVAFVHPKDVPHTLAKVQQLIQGQEAIDFDNRYRCKEGSYRWLSWRATTDSGLIYAVGRDVTEQKRQSILIEQTHTAAQVGGWELDFVTNQLYWTEETYRIHDTTPADYQPTVESAIAFYAPESVPIVSEAVHRAMRDGTPWEFELEMITARKRRIWVHAVGKVETEDGRAIRAYGAFQDITTRKATEAALRQSEVRNRAILDALPDTVFISDRTGVLLDGLSGDDGIYYVPVAQFLGKRVDEVLPSPVGQQLYRAIHKAANGTRQLVEYPLLIQGEWRHFEARLVPLDVDKVLAVVRDITEQKRAEEERFIRRIAEAVPHTMYVYDLDEQRHVYINRQVNLDLGYSPEEFLQLGSAFFTTVLHNSDLNRFPDLRSRWYTVSDEKVFETEYQMKRKNGEWRWFAGRDAVFLRNPDGQVRQIIGTAHDITNYKRAQQQILAALKEKDVLLKEIHHRVKNNLQIVSSLLNLQATLSKDAGILHIFTETKNRVRSMALLHETLYSAENLARIDFQRYVDILCAHLFRSYGVDTQRVRLQTAIAAVALDLDQAIPCGLMINELVSNALKYAFPNERAGTIWVTLQPHPSHQYQLCVRDNGIGLPVDLDLAQSKSLGLRLVHDLTLQINGELNVTSNVTSTEGATFTILFT